MRLLEERAVPPDPVQVTHDAVPVETPRAVDSEGVGESQVLLHAPLVQGRPLMNVDDLAAERGYALALDGPAAPEDGTLIQWVEHGQGPEQQRLAGAGRPEDRHLVARPDHDRDVSQEPVLAPVPASADCSGFQALLG